MSGRTYSMDGMGGEPVGTFLRDELYGKGNGKALLFHVCLLLLQDLVIFRETPGQY